MIFVYYFSCLPDVLQQLRMSWRHHNDVSQLALSHWQVLRDHLFGEHLV